MYLFDTDHLGILQHRTSPECQNILQRMQGHADADFYVSVVSFHEQVVGWNAYLARARDALGVMRAYERFQQILIDFATAQVVPFDQRAVDHFDHLRGERLRLGTMDLRIASIALANRFTLLTRNFVDFEKVPNLAVEDWTV
jgi:tRNA(fMet)-specific endonuclease VapC